MGELRLIEMTAPDAAENLDGMLPACFLQQPPDLPSRADYRVISFDLNYASINVGQRGTAPAVRVTIAGPDGSRAIAAIQQGAAGNAIGCRPVSSFLLGRQRAGWQLVYGLTLRVPLHTALTRLLVTADGRTITVPLVAACGSRGAGASCFPGDELGGPWISGTRYSIFLRL